MSTSVLILDDDQSMCEMLATDLSDAGYSARWSTSARAALEDAQSAEHLDVVVADLNMPEMGGIDFCRRLAENRPDLPVIVITAFGSLDTAVAAIRAGAYDFITKPFETEALQIAIDRAAQHRSLREEVQRLRDARVSEPHFDDMIGESAAMRRLYATLAKVADTETSVSLAGETGTGKELAALALHRGSRRSRGAFVALNCAAMPPQLLESELFGHVKGAFTDARAHHDGLFVQANGGTLFLDEVGELPLELQPKLLRALQERTARPVGGSTDVPFDVRLVTATNRDLEAAVDEGRFRQDLLFRINVIQIELPPLRARGNDILLLAQHFIEQFAERSGRPFTGLCSPPAPLNSSAPSRCRASRTP